MNTELRGEHITQVAIFTTAAFLVCGFLFLGNVAKAADVVVDTGNVSDLQTALNNANAGDAIYASGTYSGDLNITKPVTLTSTGTVASITGSITISSDGVTINGLDITNPDAGYGIVATDHNDITISNNHIHDIGTTLTSGSAQAIDINGSPSGVTMTNITISGNTIDAIGSSMLAYGTSGSSAKGVYIGDSNGVGTISNVSITNNTITNISASTTLWLSNPTVRLGAGAYGVLVNYGAKSTGSTPSLHITGNTVSNLNGLWAHAIGLEGNTPNAVVTNNTISELTDNKGGTDSMAVRLESNPSATSTVTLTGNTFDGKTISVSISAVIVNTDWNTLTPDPYTYPEVLFGDYYYYYGINAFSNIQDAVNTVADNGTVTVATGTYNGPVQINKPLILNGAQAGQDATTRSGAESIIISGDKSGTIQVSATGDPVIINGFTIGSTSTPSYKAIHVNGTSTQVNVLNNIIEPATVDGINLYMAENGTVSNNWVQGAGVSGITGGDDNNTTATSDDIVTVATISNNKVENSVNGITGYMKDSHITGNTVIGFATTTQSAGIDGQFANTVISGNEVYGYDEAGAGAGLAFAPDSNGYRPFSSDITVSGNNIHDNYVGVYIAQPVDSSIAVTNNKITNSTVSVAFAGYGAGVFGATNNWWGSNAAPTVAAEGSATGTVVFSPWYANEDMTSFGLATTTSGTSTEATIEQQQIASTTTSIGTVEVDIPAGTVISGPADWDGSLNPPTVTTTVVAPTTDTHNTASPVMSIEVGMSETPLMLSAPAKLTFAGQAGKNVGWSQSGEFHQITAACDSATNPTLGDGEDCVVSNDGIGNLLVWTRHFTTFTTYTTSPIVVGTTPYVPPTTGGGGGGGYVAPVVTLAPVATPTVTTPAPTVTTPAPAGQVLGAAVFRFTRTLDLGAQGNDVTELQNMLISEGVYSGPVTGYYGPLTEGAVKKLQAKYGISQVGAVGPLTLAKLNELESGATAGGQVLGAATSAETQAKISELKAQLASLIEQVIALMQAQVSQSQGQ